MSNMSNLDLVLREADREHRQATPRLAQNRTLNNNPQRPRPRANQIRTYYQAVKKLTDAVGRFCMHYALSLDLDEQCPSPDSMRVFQEKHAGSRDVLEGKISDARVECKFAFENVRFWTAQLGKPLADSDSDGRNLLNMLCIIGRNGIIDAETAKLRRERFRAIAKRQLKKADDTIEFLSPYELEEEFRSYLAARKKRLERAKNRG